MNQHSWKGEMMAASAREIRVFVSSTFLDMQDERNYLNRKVFPLLESECAARGVSFFAVDLRWGITKEQSEHDETIELCMRQIDRCVPFFIGLIGNRYGWIPDDQSLTDRYPWLSQWSGLSVTEMEFRRYFEQAKGSNRCHFAIKSPELMSEATSDGHEDKLEELAKLVEAETGKLPAVYRSLEELGDRILAYLMAALDELYPSGENALESQLAMYEGEINTFDDSLQLSRLEQENLEQGGNPFEYARRDYYAVDMVDRCVARICECIPKMGMMYTEPGTTRLCDRLFLSATASSPYLQNSILVFLEASERLRSVDGLLSYLLEQLMRFVPSDRQVKRPDARGNARDYAVAISAVVDAIPADRDVTVFITGLHLLRPCSNWHYLLPFLSSIDPRNVCFVLLSEDEMQGALLEERGLFFRHFFASDIAAVERGGILGAFLKTLERRGKNLDVKSIEGIYDAGALKDYSAAVFLQDYLSNYVIFENLERTMDALAALVRDGLTIYEAVWEAMVSVASQRDVELACEMLRLVDFALLRESDLQRLLSSAFGITVHEFERAFEIVRPFTILRADGLRLRSPECRVELLAHGEATPVEADLGAALVDWKLGNGAAGASGANLQLDEAYALCELIEHSLADDAAAVSLMHKIVTNRSFLRLASEKDWRLLRSAWVWLKGCDALDIASLYADYVSFDNGLIVGLETYDMLMCTEHDVTGGWEFEAFLDIPSSYSTDFECREKELLDRKVIDAIPAMVESSGSGKVARDVIDSIRRAGCLFPEMLAYAFEKLCEELHARGSLERAAAQFYLRVACESDNPRQAYDALRYLKDLPLEKLPTDSRGEIMRERAQRCNASALSTLELYA